MPRRFINSAAAALPIWLIACVSASAETRVSIANGRVTVVAKDATVRQIVAEWSRVGNMTVVNIERLPVDAVTLELRDMSEDDALSVVLRSVSGYMVSERQVRDGRQSRFERLLVMPSSRQAPSTSSTQIETTSAAPAPPPLAEADTSTPSGIADGGQPQNAAQPVGGARVFDIAPVVAGRLQPPAAGGSAVVITQQVVNSPSSSGTARSLRQTVVSSPGAMVPGAAGAVPAPAPVAIGLQGTPAVSPSELVEVPKASATPGAVVPQPSRSTPPPDPVAVQ